MNMLDSNHQQLVKGVNCSFLRYLHKKIDWNDRLIGVFGSMGVGKTTLILQHIKNVFGDENKALYLDMDNIWFRNHSLREAGIVFYNTGGTHFFLDDVHMYPNWMEEIGRLLDLCPRLSITFTISSLFVMDQVKTSFNRDVACYKLHAMSFREFLAYESLMDLPVYSLGFMFLNFQEVERKVNSEINVVTAFHNYMEHGCYPFYWQDPDAYSFRLQQIATDTIRKDFPTVGNVDSASIAKIQKLLLLIAEAAPDYPLPSVLAKAAGLNRIQVHTFLDYLQRAGLIHILKTVAGSHSQKVYIGNPNLYLALFGERHKRMNIAESFFVNQLSCQASVELKENNDFLIDGKYSFLVGDPLKDYDRIRVEENAFGAVYGLSRSLSNRMPIWLLGLCY